MGENLLGRKGNLSVHKECVQKNTVNKPLRYCANMQDSKAEMCSPIYVMYPMR